MKLLKRDGACAGGYTTVSYRACVARTYGSGKMVITIATTMVYIALLGSCVYNITNPNLTLRKNDRKGGYLDVDESVSFYVGCGDIRVGNMVPLGHAW